MLISSLLTPLITAKISLNQLLTISQGVKTAVILGLALYVQWVGDRPMIVLVFLLIAMVAFLDGCANPIRQSLLPHYVEERDLLRANSIAETVIQSIQVGSWFVGSSLLLLFTPSRLIWGVVVLFHRNLAFKASTRCGTYGTSTNKEMVVNYGRVAIHPSNACTKSSCTYGFTGIDGRSSVGRSDFTCLCRRSIAGFFSMVGLSQRHFFIGMIIGSMICLKWTKFIERKKAMFISGGALLSAIFTLCFAVSITPFMALLCSLLIGLCGQLKNIPQQTIIQTSISKEKLPTVYTSLNVIVTGVFGLSSFMMGMLSEWYGIRVVFFLSASLLLLVSVIAYKNKTSFT